MKTRLLSILSSGIPSLNVKHFVGLPPEVSGGNNARLQMGPPAFLVIDETADGVFLYRYDADGKCVGDTWHINIDDAKHQADYEYEGLMQEWQNVPLNVKDIVAFGLAHLKPSN